MQRILICCLASLLILSSCKFQDSVSTTPQTPGTGDTALKVVLPNGGETLAEGSSYQIQWTGTATLVRIMYSVDNGTSWTLVKDSLKNIGQYSWSPIPNTVSSQCRVRVSSLDGASSDASDNVFSIVKNANKSLKITSPNGGETWQAGTSAQITWYSSGIDSVKIDYTIDNGQNWAVITNSTKNTGIYYWQPIPNTPTTLAKVRIRDAQDGVTSTESANTFQILPEQTVKVLTPNGGEQWYAGSSNNITWQSTNIANVKIEFTINGGATWTTIIASTPSTGVYSWNGIPNVSSLQCKIRISDASDGIPSDVSDNNFFIATPGSQLLAVTSPKGGEAWPAGTSQNITWSAAGITDVKIEYTINNGITWNTITNSTPSTGFYTWTQLPNTPSTNCKVRISDAQDGSPSAVSDNLFSITPAPSVIVTSPNGGEVWMSGTSQKIKYTSVNIPNVKIEFTTDGGANWTTITNSTPSIGEYTWDNIPNTNSYQCKIKISDAMFGSPSDISDNNFTITNQVIKTISITSPVGGEVWEASTSKTVTWAAVGVGNVKLELTTNNGLTWITIENSIPNTGSYSWNVPNTQSTQCKIKISDIGGSPSSVSPNTFTIKPAASITLLSPNGNEVIRAGQAFNITWKVVGIDNVKIEYTANSSSNLVEWKTIVASTPAAAGSYAFGFAQPSSDCRVRISEAVSGSPTATSAGTFTVLPKTSVTVISPNGSESWILGETYEIRWKSVNVSKVKIEYTLNNGADGWNTIVEDLPNGELYNWKVPTNLPLPSGQNFIGSSLCKIRVSEYLAANPTVAGASDESDDVFSIFSKIIRVVTPNGGEIWKKQATQRIEWMGAGVNNVKIEYTLDNGGRWNTIVDSYPNYGAYDWFTPNVVSSLGKIRISDATDPTFSDQTKGYFSLVAELPFISIEQPRLNDTWNVGSTQTIAWYNSDNIYTVKLEYGYYNGTDTVWTVLKNSISSPGNQRNVYAWTVPNTPSNYCRIRISGIAIIDPNQNTVRPMRTYSANFIIK